MWIWVGYGFDINWVRVGYDDMRSLAGPRQVNLLERFVWDVVRTSSAVEAMLLRGELSVDELGKSHDGMRCCYDTASRGAVYRL